MLKHFFVFVFAVVVLTVGTPASAAFAVIGKLRLDGRCFQLEHFDSQAHAFIANEAYCNKGQWPVPFHAKLIGLSTRGSKKYVLTFERGAMPYQVILPKKEVSY